MIQKQKCTAREAIGARTERSYRGPRYYNEYECDDGERYVAALMAERPSHLPRAQRLANEGIPPPC
jgi:hypothetical protein